MLLYGRALAASTEPFFPRGFWQFFFLSFYLPSAFHLHFHFGSYFMFCFPLFQLIIYQFLLSFFYFFGSFYFIYSRIPLTWVNWYGKPSGCAENPDNWIFFFLNRLRWQVEVWLLLFMSCTLTLPFDHN